MCVCVCVCVCVHNVKSGDLDMFIHQSDGNLLQPIGTHQLGVPICFQLQYILYPNLFSYNLINITQRHLRGGKTFSLNIKIKIKKINKFFLKQTLVVLLIFVFKLSLYLLVK